MHVFLWLYNSSFLIINLGKSCVTSAQGVHHPSFIQNCFNLTAVCRPIFSKLKNQFNSFFYFSFLPIIKSKIEKKAS